MTDVRWSADFPAARVRMVSETVDFETGERLVVVRHDRSPRFVYTAVEWDNLEPVAPVKRDGAA